MEIHGGLFPFAKPFPEGCTEIRACLLLTLGRERAQPRVLARLVKKSLISKSAPNHTGQHCGALLFLASTANTRSHCHSLCLDEFVLGLDRSRIFSIACIFRV